jgi:hypothetical protein
MDRPFQRKGAKSNSHVGREFESKIQSFFANQGVHLLANVKIPIGINGLKPHSFDLGNIEHKIIVECKSHTWTESGNVPSAKMTTWNQAMYLFYATPTGFRKIFFVLKAYSPKRKQTLAEHYIHTNSHLIPKDIEFWEFDESTEEGARLR